MLTLPTAIAALPDGDARAFMEALWQKYHRYMFSIACRYAREPAALEDIVSESLIRLMEHADTLSRLSRPQMFAYIRQTVRNQAVERARKNRREKAVVDGRMLPESVNLADPDWQRVELGEELDALMDSVALLPERERVAIQMKYGERRDTLEIAQALGVAESTARKYIANARRLLKQIMYDDGGAGDGD